MKNDVTAIDTSSEEIIHDFEIIQGENKEVIRYNKSNKHSDLSDITLWSYKDKEKIEDEKVVISMFATKTKINVKNALEVNGE